MYYEIPLNKMSVDLLDDTIKTELLEALYSHGSNYIHINLVTDDDNKVIDFIITEVEDDDCGYVWQYHNPMWYIGLIDSYNLVDVSQDDDIDCSCLGHGCEVCLPMY